MRESLGRGRASRLMLVTFLVVSGMPCLGTPQGRRTLFLPEVHGFKFSNTFKNDVVFDITTGGLCGGMVYAAYDFYKARKPIPKTIDYRPATGTPLERYILQRQFKTFENQLDKWTELNSNPGGIRNSEFYRWGIQGFDGGRLQELRELIDSGNPAPLGLWHADGHPDRPGDHQVLAIGYDVGRYDGRFGSNVEDLKIFIYDPNRPNDTMVLQPDPKTQTFYYSNLPNKEKGRWLTYFVDKKYALRQPPTIQETDLGRNDGLIRELIVEIRTGSSHLRGGSDNVSATIGMFGRAAYRVANLNMGVRWIGEYSQFVAIKLPAPMLPELITSFALNTQFKGGVGGSNWNVDQVAVRARGGGVNRVLLNKRGTPLVRFTGQVHDYVMPLRWLLMDLRTGARGLSGGSLNANAIVMYRGRVQAFNNFNEGRAWGARSNVYQALQLTETLPIASFSLACTYGGSGSRSPWDLDYLKLRVREGGRDQVIFERTGTPVFHYSSTTPSFLARIR